MTGAPRLAAMLKLQIREYVRIARRHDGKPDAHRAIREEMLALWLGMLREQGSDLPAPEVAEKLLETDLELNTQGLLVWLARDRKSNT